MTAPDLDIDAIRARAEAATPGPWHAITSGPSGGDHWYVTDADESIALIHASDGEDEDTRQPDAEFIAHAREDVPKLLAALEQERAGTVDAARALDEAEAYGRESDRIAARWRGRAERAEAERDRLREAVDAVRALHKPARWDGTDWCSDCVAEDAHDAVEVPWPCPTTRALDEHLEDS